MPYKDKEKARNYAKEGMRRKREGITQDKDVIPDNVIPETVPPLGTLPERPRYLTLSDGQVLDRAHPPKLTKRLTAFEVKAMEACNRADKTIIDPVKAERYERWKEGKEVDPLLEALASEKEREKLRKVCSSLGDHNQLDNVYYGTVPMNEVARLLTAF